MRKYSFAASEGHRVSQYGSVGAVVSPILADPEGWHVVGMHLEPEGVLGAHEAAADQLFLVVGGGGAVSGEGTAPVPVGPGAAVLWTEGETHETRAGPEGLSAIVIEGVGLASAIVLATPGDSADQR